MGYTGEGDPRPLAEILAAPIPKDVFSRFQIGKSFVDQADADNFQAIVEYILKPEFSEELGMMVVMEAVGREHNLCDTQGFLDWAKNNKSLWL